MKITTQIRIWAKDKRGIMLGVSSRISMVRGLIKHNSHIKIGWLIFCNKIRRFRGSFIGRNREVELVEWDNMGIITNIMNEIWINFVLALCKLILK